MRLYLNSCIMMLALLYGTSRSAILFADDFSDPQFSIKGWTSISADESILNFTGSTAFIQNNSANYSALAVHRSPVKTPTFTISAKISSKYPGSGLYFCFQELPNGFGGYGALLSDNGIYIYKFYPESLVIVANQNSAFVKLGENRLCVSKIKDLISIFCNGYFICSVRDSEFLSGDMALIVPPLSESSFDDFSLEDHYRDSLQFASFTDEFLEKSTFGWFKYGNALTEWKNSHMQILTNLYQEYYTGLEIPLNSFYMKTAVSFNGGDSGSIYGLFIKTVEDSTEAPSFYQFAISGDKKFAMTQSGGNYELLPHKSITGNSFIIDGSDTVFRYDTLELSREQNVLTFYANGVELGKSEITEKIIGAGLFVSKGLRISFDRFQISDLEMQTTIKRSKIRDIKIPTQRMNSKMIDLLGRCLFEKSIPITSKLILKINESGNWKKELKTGEKRLR